MTSQIPKEPFKFGLYTSRSHRKWMIGAYLSVFVAMSLDRYGVIVLRNLTDSIVGPTLNYDAVWYWTLFYSLLYASTSIIWRLSGFNGMQWFTNQRGVAYRDLYEYITFHSKNYFNNRFAGALSNKISNAADGVENLFSRILWKFFPTFAGIILYVIFAWNSNAWLGLIIAIWSTAYVVINIYFAKKIRAKSYTSAESSSTLRGVIIDSISNISLIHESAHITNEHGYIRSFIKKFQKADLDEWWLSEWFLVANGFFVFIFMLLMFGTSVYLLQAGLVSVGVLVMVIAIVRDISSQLFSLGQEIKEAARLYGQINEGLEEVLHEHLIVDKAGSQEATISEGKIEFNNVDFSYEKSLIFKNFSIHIEAGQKVGLVGKSGAGKTTFISLLLRHFEIEGGSVTIDNLDISSITLESLRKAIAVVPQDTSLFHRTIRENIGYSRPDATDEEIQHAAKLAQASGFIEKLPKKYDTLIGERGVKLSGGQRQRIAIARAFLKNAPILILDEATSSLDSESEHAIQVSLRSLMKGRTVIAIAHRLSTLKEMDRIIVIENGDVVEDGAVDELLKKTDGAFKKVWDHQVKGFIVE